MTRRNCFLVFGPLALVLASGCASQGGPPAGRDTRTLFVTQHPEVSSNFAQAILAGNIIVGMSRDMVEAAWGEPTRIMKDRTDGKGDEKWIYGNYLVNNAVTHLYFKTGELVLYEFVDTHTQMTQSVSDPNQKLTLLSRPQNEAEGGSKNSPN